MKKNNIYKYRSFEDPNIEKIIKNSALYFSKTNAFNDPYDCHLSFRENYTDEDVDQYIKNRQEKQNPISAKTIKYLKSLSNNEFSLEMKKEYNKIIDDTGVLSLSKNEKSILMWSHYASNHTGLVFEFDTTLDEDFFELPERVNYTKIYPMFSYIDVDDVAKSIITKYVDWEYEDEYRIVDLSHQGEVVFEKNH